MKLAFTYQDEKSDKFWAIDYSGCELCVHYGKTGAIGKYEIKEFDSETTCEKEAKKLIASKTKKGYKENHDFDFDACIYYDTEDYGPHPKTSHPRFVSHFTDEFYYDCGDEDAPFGSDEGSDTLHIIEEKLRKKRSFDFTAFPKALITKEWEMNYIPVETLDKDAVKAMAKDYEAETDMQQSDMVTYAAAFAQIKATGRLDAKLKENALLALKRLAVMYNDGELTDTQQKMYNDLSSFEAQEK